MNTAERQIEDHARTVTCPNCGAPPNEPCRYPGEYWPAFNYSHTGRRLKARVTPWRDPWPDLTWDYVDPEGTDLCGWCQRVWRSRAKKAAMEATP